MKEDLQRLTDRVLQVEIDLGKVPKGGQQTDYTVPIITGLSTLGAAIFGAMALLVGQYWTGKREERRALQAGEREERRAVLTAERAMELARHEAIFEQTQKILDYRLKQMELFYAPMFALLNQSESLYQKMLDQLAEDEPERYKRLAERDAEGNTLLVLASYGVWKGFRLLDQLPAVKANPKALPLVVGILEIGDRMTKIISENAGLASKDIIELLGEYMAHYAILSSIHKSPETKPYEPGWHKRGYYPRDLNEKIKQGYREVNDFLDGYAEASKRMLEALPILEAKRNR
ncbi:hypothetical protein L0156_16545 [bacterium]|nr:hypothetical protein [bacterium]